LIDDERAFTDRLSSHSYYRNSPTIERDIRAVLDGLEHIKITNRAALGKKNHYKIEPDEVINAEYQVIRRFLAMINILVFKD